jgi:putative nucleotidyltransferase with HDIG domain
MTTQIAQRQHVLIHDVIRKVANIATLPEVTARIIETVEDPRSSTQQLHQIVTHDPALVTRILKVVNSAFYGLPGQVGSVERAIVLLGINAVKNIAIAASLGQLFRGVGLCDGYSAKDLWRHCVAVGVTARELARQYRLPLADEVFLAGMIHDVGILVELQVYPEQLRTICDRSRREEAHFHEIEQDVLGMTHQQLGAALAEQWKFPRFCRLVASHHHNPQILAEDHRIIVTLVHVADMLCAADGRLGFDLTARRHTLADAGLEGISLDPAVVERVRPTVSRLVNDAASMFA